MNKLNQGYFQLQQSQEVTETFAKHKVKFMFIGKSGAIILGYPAATQDVDLFPQKSAKNATNLITALRELEFLISDEIAEKII